MSLERACLQSVAEAPDDDGNRLIFADWLDEHGHPERARFLRDQYQLAAQGLPPTEDRAGEAAWRTVLPRISGRWEYHCGIPAGVAYGPVDTTRGDATSPLTLFLRDVEATITVPTIRAVVLDCKEIVGYHDRERTRPFESYGDLEDEDTEALAELPAMRQVERLALRHALSGEGWPILVESLYLTRLRDLDLTGSGVSDIHLNLLATSPLAPRLKSLRLRGSPFGYQAPVRPCVNVCGVAVLAQSASFAQLRVLDLAYNTLEDSAVDALLRSAHLSRDLHLDLTGNRLNPGQLQRLRERFPAGEAT